MTLRRADPGFFVGYLDTVPPAIRRFALAYAVVFIAALGGAALALALITASSGSGAYVDELGGKHLTGVLELEPYPILRVPASAGQAARAVMLAGPGKFGVLPAATALGGRWVDAGGVFVKRGDLDMLLVGGDIGLRNASPALAAPASAPPTTPLGRWRLTGEICDGKCYGGAMRPGSGLAHKACANLCIQGGVPPVFVSTAPVEGRNFFLLADSKGGPMPKALLDRTAELLVIEGTVERRDDLPILRVDANSVKEARP